MNQHQSLRFCSLFFLPFYCILPFYPLPLIITSEFISRCLSLIFVRFA